MNHIIFSLISFTSLSSSAEFWKSLSNLPSTLWFLASGKKLFHFNSSDANFSPSHADLKWTITFEFLLFFSYLNQLTLYFYALSPSQLPLTSVSCFISCFSSIFLEFYWKYKALILNLFSFLWKLFLLEIKSLLHLLPFRPQNTWFGTTLSWVVMVHPSLMRKAYALWISFTDFYISLKIFFADLKPWGYFL